MCLTSLLVIENRRQTAHSIATPSGDHSTTVAPPARWLDEQFIHIIHAINFFSFSFPVVNSAIKSAKAYALITVLGRYWTLDTLSSIAQRNSCAAAFGLFIVFRSGLSVWTIMVCSWKYGLSFQAAVISAKPSFSIGEYLPSAP